MALNWLILDKYDKAIKKMIDYSKTLNPNNFKEKRIEKWNFIIHFCIKHLFWKQKAEKKFVNSWLNIERLKKYIFRKHHGFFMEWWCGYFLLP